MSQKKQSQPDVESKPVESDADLPEREPLTPELVEDEAIRGDFMLRWALILLTFLMACTLISETSTLVHIKSGQYTIENGLPARTGVFSSSAESRPWYNLSWLFDVILAGVHAIGGPVGLTILKALIAAIAFGVIAHTSRKDVSTWWGTVCAVLALLVCYPQMTALPEVVTLLGLACTLYFLNGWWEDGERKHLTRLVILFAVWSNLDPRMYLGLSVVVLYAIGEWTGNWLGFSSGLKNSAQRKSLWIATGLCLVAAMLNPFGWHSLLSPVVLYGAEYPAFRELHPVVSRLDILQYYPMTDDQFWIQLNHNTFAGLVVIVTALVTFGLNHRRLDFGHLFVAIGFLSFAVLTTHDLAAAAVVCAVLATLNAQQWYQHTFRQTYSVQTSELVFSRGGRAVTVLAMFGLAYLAISGQLYLLGKDGQMTHRMGFGFDYNLQASIEGLLEDTKDTYDDRPFNFSEQQGDLLIWIGKRPFIDSRLSLYAGGSDDLIQRFSQLRNDLRNGNKKSEKGEGWQAAFDEFKITHVTTRLDTRISAPNPDYQTHLGLLNSEHWQMTSFGPTSSVFHRTDIRGDDPKLDAFLKENRGQFTVEAFRESKKRPVERVDFARKPTFFDKYLSRPKPKLPNGILLAQHYYRLFDALSAQMQVSNQRGQPLQLPKNFLQGVKPDEFLVSLLYLLIRNANEGLAEDPQNSDGYMLLGLAYDRLRDFEMANIRRPHTADDLQELEENMRATTVQFSQRELMKTRLRQATSAYRQCLVIDPDNIKVTRALSVIFEQQRFLDTSIEMLERSIAIAKDRPLSDNMSKLERDLEERLRKSDAERLEKLRKQVQPTLDKVEAMIPRLGVDRAGRMERLKAMSTAMTGGCWSKAIQLVEDDLEMFVGNPGDIIPYVETLLTMGRIEDAVEQYQSLGSSNDALPKDQDWRLLGASIEMCRCEYASAKRTFLRHAREIEDRGFEDLTRAIPFVAESPLRLPIVFENLGSRNTADPRLGPWAKIHSMLVHQALHISPTQAADQLLKVAICELELGDTENAAETLQKILDSAPDASIRPLARFYLQLITGKSIAQTPPLVGKAAESKPTKTETKPKAKTEPTPKPAKKPKKKAAGPTSASRPKSTKP